tara:strand:+ start:1068 stop:1229 length:162 start_codon:yes stop_codon:yes gene_type:complete
MYPMFGQASQEQPTSPEPQDMPIPDVNMERKPELRRSNRERKKPHYLQDYIMD